MWERKNRRGGCEIEEMSMDSATRPKNLSSFFLAAAAVHAWLAGCHQIDLDFYDLF